jgi:hypothetical protein
MHSTFLLIAVAGLFQGAGADTVQLSSKLFSDNQCKHQFKQVPQGPIDLGKCQFGDGAHVMYTCVNDTKLHLTLNLGGKDCNKTFDTYEANLTNGECSPLHPLGFASGIWTWTGGCGAAASTLPKEEAKQQQASTPCCQGACKEPGMEKYWSIAKGILGQSHCGEACMDPKKYNLYHFFEKNLTKAENTVTPCHDFGYTVYDSTPTHGFGPVKMTLDLYDKPKEGETVMV